MSRAARRCLADVDGLCEVGHQLYAVGAMSRRSALTGREKALLKGTRSAVGPPCAAAPLVYGGALSSIPCSCADLIFSKDGRVRDAVLGAQSTNFSVVLSSLRTIAGRCPAPISVVLRFHVITHNWSVLCCFVGLARRNPVPSAAGQCGVGRCTLPCAFARLCTCRMHVSVCDGNCTCRLACAISNRCLCSCVFLEILPR